MKVKCDKCELNLRRLYRQENYKEFHQCCPRCATPIPFEKLEEIYRPTFFKSSVIWLVISFGFLFLWGIVVYFFWPSNTNLP